MSRYLYTTAAVLLLLSLIAFGMTFTVNAYQPDLPTSGSLWKTLSLFLLLGGLLAAFGGVMMAMFEQVGGSNGRRRRPGGTIIEFPAGGRSGRAAGQEKYSPRDRPPGKESASERRQQ